MAPDASESDGVDDDPVLGTHACQYLNRLPEVASELHCAQLDLAVGLYDAHLRSFRAEQNRVRRKRQGRLHFRLGEAHLGIASRQDLLLRVVQRKLHQEGPGIRSDHARRADHLGLEDPVGKFRKGHFSGLAGSDASGHGLGDLHEYAKLRGLRQVEELLAATGDDEIAGIDITGRDGAGKWRCDPGKRLELSPAGAPRRGHTRRWRS